MGVCPTNTGLRTSCADEKALFSLSFYAIVALRLMENIQNVKILWLHFDSSDIEYMRA